MRAAGLGLMLVGASAAQAEAPRPFTLAYAVETALATSPALALGRTAVARAAGVRRASEAPFDWDLDAQITRRLAHTAIDPRRAETDDGWAAGVGARKRFGFGLEIAPSIQLQSVDRRLEGGVAPETIALHNVAIVELRLTQQLLRGFGRGGTAELDASDEEARAALFELQHRAADRVAAVAELYWSYQAAHAVVDVLRGAEGRAQQLLARTRQLVAEDERPLADLGQVQANLADRTRDRVLAEQAVDDLRTALALEIGLPAEQIGLLGRPSTPFPDAPTVDAGGAGPGTAGPGGAGPDPAVETSPAARRDLAAAEARVRAAVRRLEGAEDARRPDLAAIVNVGYGGIAAGDGVGDFFGSLGGHVPGLDLAVGLAFRWPVGDSAAAGYAAQIAADAQAARIVADDAARRITAGVAVATRAVRTTGEAVRRSSEATRFHLEAVANEAARMQSGLTTLLDVIQSNDRLTSAVLQQIASHERYARARVRLAFEAGTLVTPTADGATVDLAALDPSARRGP